MESLVYIRLMGFTAGTLLGLFWMVVILGYRRQRNFERIFFFLCAAFFLFYSGSLLALNAQIYYTAPPAALNQFAVLIISLGLCMLPAVLLHLHLEYAQTRGMLHVRVWKRSVLFVFYAACAHLAVHRLPPLLKGARFDFFLPGSSLGPGFAILFSLAMAWCGNWQWRFAANAPDKPQRYFHRALLLFFLLALLGAGALHSGAFPMQTSTMAFLATAISLLPLLPFSVLIYLVQRHNFLQIGRQKNLLYAVSATFLALLYLSLVRRVSTLLEPALPPEASASILLFVLVVFIEPLQRALGRTLRETAQREFELVQRVAQEILEGAKQGDLSRLTALAELRIRETFEMASVRLILRQAAEQEAGTGANAEEVSGDFFAKPTEFPILRSGQLLGVLQAQPHGAAISGETRAAMEFLCEQLPGALDLCRLIEEKLVLERELAQRERFALLGQMAASISHNLKNPLGSIKTILQVQMENPDLPAAIRGETKMILDEVGRLSSKLNQLLQFSRPAVRTGSGAASCDLAAILEEVTGVLRHEAAHRGIALEVRTPDARLIATATAEAAGDILSNLLVNALEATARGGRVLVSAEKSGANCVLTVEDDGPGIPAAVREKILRPFFTTKAQGTGLGLAIVARRVAESAGTLEWQSPIRDGRGTRFRVALGIAPFAKQGV